MHLRSPKQNKTLEQVIWATALILLYYLMSGFIRHSAGLGIAGLIRDLSERSPFYAPDAPVVTFIMFLHMVTGALLTIFAPLQLITPLRKKWPRMHRWSGRLMVGFGVFTAFGATVYAVLRSTTGGLFMDISSSVYGILMIWAAVQTYRYGARKQWVVHRRWGIRFSVLVIASWLYRVHYVIWDQLTGGLWTTPDMTGPFDKFQAWAFYLSYLLLAEAYFYLETRQKRRARQRRQIATPQTT